MGGEVVSVADRDWSCSLDRRPLVFTPRMDRDIRKGAFSGKAAMSTVGLTKAREKALRDYGNASDRMLSELVRGGFLEDAPMNCYNITPRGHAARAAPRMTQAEYDWLCYIESGAEGTPSPM